MQMYVLPLVAFANLMAGALAGAGPGAGSPVAGAGNNIVAAAGNNVVTGADNYLTAAGDNNIQNGATPAGNKIQNGATPAGNSLQNGATPAGAKPSAGANATVGATPGAGAKPTVGATPGAGAKPTVGATPGAGAKPTVDAAPGTKGTADSACSGPNARTKPPPGAIVVDPSTEYNGSYLSIKEALAYLPNVTEEQTIFLFPGLYKEKVYIPWLAGPLVLQGYTCDTMSYAENTVTISSSMSQKDLPPEFKDNRNALTSTMRLKSRSGVKMYNINAANTGSDRENGGAAVYVDASDFGFYGCNFTSFQDTLCAHRGRELFARSYISGAVDIVWGMRAMAWFESCDIETVEKGWITSNGNRNATIESEYVFNHARVFGSSGAGSTLLGRPWRPYARVVWQNSELGDVVDPKGWRTWNDTTSTDNVYFKEFNNNGAGAATSERVAFSGQLDAPVDITHILGDDYKSQWWVDPAFL